MRSAARGHGGALRSLVTASVIALVLLGALGLRPAAALADDPLQPTCELSVTDETGATTSTVRNGAPVTLTAWIGVAGATSLPPGTIAFWNGDTQIVDDIAVFPSGPTLTQSATTASLPPGNYEITASFTPNVAYAFSVRSCLSTPKPLAVSEVGLLQTRTDLTVTPSTITDAPSEVTLNAHVVQELSTVTPPGGLVTFAVVGGAAIGQAQLDADGVATLTKGGWGLAPGEYTIEAMYTGDALHSGSSDRATLRVQYRTQIAASADTSVAAGGLATFTGTLTDRNRIPVSGRALTFSLPGGDTCESGPTDSYGNASCTMRVNEPVGIAQYKVAWAGDPLYEGSSATGSIVVSRGTPKLVVTHAPFAVSGFDTTLSATLTNAGGRPIAGALVTLAIRTSLAVSCRATTNASGVASCNVHVVATAATYSVTGTFAGNDDYLGAPVDSSIPVIVGILAQLSFVANAAPSEPGSSRTISFKLTDTFGTSVTGVTVVISFNGGLGVSAATDVAGVATISATMPALGGTYQAKATFAGTGPYLAAAPASGTITVSPAPTTLTVVPTAPILNGTKPTLSATLLLWDGTPLSGKTVVLSAAGTATCTALTSTLGTATCPTTTAVSGSSRDIVVTASFAGEAGGLRPSTNIGPAIVFVIGAGGGFFVRGDLATDSSVEFWGAQWAKKNALSRGAAPDAFKGFAGAVATPAQCGAAWTTRPGNSTPPPAGPLPKYLGVVVSSSVQKNGSAITGDVKKIVVVKTDSAYDANPGHAGTGVVVGTFCG